MSRSLNPMDLNLVIRTAASNQEIHLSHLVEQKCYSLDTAGSLTAFLDRYRRFPNYYFLAFSGRKVIGVLNGVRLTEPDLSDDDIKKTRDLPANGKHFCVLTVAVEPEFRRLGIGSKLIRALIHQAEMDKLHSIVLMCEKHLIPFYERLGFIYIKPSESQHGGISWHEMHKHISDH